MTTLYDHLKRAPILVGEVRGMKNETAKKFDKSDKNAPPLVFGVFKLHIELLAEGVPVMVSVYPDPGQDCEKLAESIGLKRGVLVCVAVAKSEMKEGMRKVVTKMDGISLLSGDDELKLRAV